MAKSSEELGLPIQALGFLRISLEHVNVFLAHFECCTLLDPGVGVADCSFARA